MERGSIRFIYEDGKMPSLEIELANNNLWLTKYEIAHLLNCFVQKVEANLRSIFKELLWEEDCSYIHRYTDKNIEKQTVYYNLEVLIFLSYRINSMEAKVFRKFAGSALRKQLEKDKKLKESMRITWPYSPELNFVLN